MPYYEFECPNAHNTRKKMTFAEKRDVGETVPCPEPDCGQDARQLFTGSKAQYFCTGFYGSVPTVDAHNTNQV